MLCTSITYYLLVLGVYEAQHRYLHHLMASELSYRPLSVNQSINYFIINYIYEYKKLSNPVKSLVPRPPWNRNSVAKIQDLVLSGLGHNALTSYASVSS